ncbi:LysR family transcriptional regulator [Mesorhizobium sp. M0296]|uniref:helix-turn-helix domain-containing protein n=1 Tax=Mesorhizobium sp. M0296 TaxID=2956931 RepID=UPI00333861F7
MHPTPLTECHELANELPSAQAVFTFEAAAGTPSFSEAGRFPTVAQPAVSKNIAALEAHIGTRLFIREKSKLRLNAEGESLHRAVQLRLIRSLGGHEKGTR